jgi:hypothetical protein
MQAADRFWKNSPAQAGEYPQSIVDLVIFHKLHFHMSPEQAWKCFAQLKSEFVDWNEVRISVVREIQEQLSDGRDSLELSVFVKDFLELIHSERRRVTLDPLIEENLTDIRKFFKKVKNLDTATVDLVLMRTKGHPVVPLSAHMERQLGKIRVVKKADSRDKKSKHLYELVGADQALSLHHYVLFHTHANAGEDGVAENLPAALSNARAKSGASKAKAKAKAKASRTRKVVRQPAATKRVRAGATTKKKSKKDSKKSR